MLTIDVLKASGADVESGLARCMGREDFYLSLVTKALQDNNFDVLQEKVAERDYDAAFEAAHALKGALGNLSITSLFEPVQTVTEFLRARTQMDYAPIVSEIKAKHDELVKLCES